MLDQHYNRLPVGLLAELVECCTGIAEIMGLNLARACFYFQVSFQLLVQ